MISVICKTAFDLIRKQNLPIKKYTNSGVALGTQTFVPTTFNTEIFLSLVPGLKEELNCLNPLSPQLLQLSAKEFLQELRNLIDIKKNLESQEIVENAGKVVIDVGLDPSVSCIDNLRFFQDVKEKAFYVYCISRNEYAQIHKYIFDAQVSLVPKEVRPILLSKVEAVSTVYSPSLPVGCFKSTKEFQERFNIDTDKVLNLYLPPPWKNFVVKSHLPPQIDYLVRFLFVGEDCIKHVYRWLRSLLFDHELLLPIMVLHSAGGTGKGLLFDHVLSALVGTKNFSKPPSGQLGRFDKYLSKTHAYYASEAILTEEKSNRLKDLYDMKSNFESKGVDIGNGQRIAARFILSSNDSSNLYMSYDARKFTVPDVTRGPQLAEHMSQEDIKYLTTIGDRPEDLAAFAYWLRDNFEPLGVMDVWHGKDFKILCERNLPEWFKVFRGMLLRRKEFTYEEFYDSFKSKNKPGIAAVERNLQMYELAIRKPVCTIVPSVDGVSDGYLYKSLIFGEEII